MASGLRKSGNGLRRKIHERIQKVKGSCLWDSRVGEKVFAIRIYERLSWSRFMVKIGESVAKGLRRKVCGTELKSQNGSRFVEKGFGVNGLWLMFILTLFQIAHAIMKVKGLWFPNFPACKPLQQSCVNHKYKNAFLVNFAQGTEVEGFR